MRVAADSEDDALGVLYELRRGGANIGTDFHPAYVGGVFSAEAVNNLRD